MKKEQKYTPEVIVPDLIAAFKKAEEIRAGGDEERHVIGIEEGIVRGHYKTKVSNFVFIGLGKQSGIVDSLAAKDLDSKGEELSTWKTATVKLLGDNNLFFNLSFSNDRGDPSTNGQLVALEVLGNRNVFQDCHITSTQDSLFLGPLPDDLVTRYIGFLDDDERYTQGTKLNLFFNCYIEGSLDFIFGAGQGLFIKCTINSIDDGREGPFYVVAPAHPLADTLGFVFNECDFTHSFKSIKPVYLARPWRDYGKATFLNCHYSDHITKEGFITWNDTRRDLTARFNEFPSVPGRVSWIDREDITEVIKETTKVLTNFE